MKSLASIVSFAFVVSISVHVSAARAQDEESPPEERLGWIAPQPSNVVQGDVLVHEDTRGGAPQRLVDLAAGPGTGFAAVWMDRRDGHFGLYVARLDSKGESVGPEVPLTEPHSARMLYPTIALGRDNFGGVAWMMPEGPRTDVSLRIFDGAGQLRGRRVLLLGRPEEGQKRSADAGEWQPRIVSRPAGGFLVAWTRSGTVEVATLDARGRAQKIQVLNPKGPKAQPGVHVASDGEGRDLVIWTSEGKHHATRLGDEPETVECKIGAPLRLLADPVGDGFWLLVRSVRRDALRHLSVTGIPDRKPIQPWQVEVDSADFAVWEGGLALVSSRAPVFETREAEDGTDAAAGREDRVAYAEKKRRHKLLLLDHEGTRLIEKPINVLPDTATDVRDVRIVSNGKRLVVGWTDHQAGDANVHTRLIVPSALLDAEKPGSGLVGGGRLNTDIASSDQIHPDIATNGTDRGLVVWQDGRFGVNTIFGRRFDVEGKFEGSEFRLPVPHDGDKARALVVPGSRPYAAMSDGGASLVVWANEGNLVYQSFDPDGRVRTKMTPLEVGPGLNEQAGVAVEAVPHGRGFVVTWVRKIGVGLVVCSIDRAGKHSEPLTVSEDAGGHRNPALARLDDDRWIVVWDAKRNRRAKPELRARFLTERGVPQGRVLHLPATESGSDWGPAVAPGPGRGFFLAWNAGSDRNRARDLVGRFFDVSGKARGDLLALAPTANEQDTATLSRAPDKSFVLAWEDDISHNDQAHARRISADGKKLGPIVSVHQRDTVYHVGRVRPRIALLGDRVAAVWGDRRRSLGWDVYLRVLGRDFDRP